jgi:hypothetical protein
VLADNNCRLTHRSMMHSQICRSVLGLRPPQKTPPEPSVSRFAAFRSALRSYRRSKSSQASNSPVPEWLERTILNLMVLKPAMPKEKTLNLPLPATNFLHRPVKIPHPHYPSSPFRHSPVSNSLQNWNYQISMHLFA